MGQDIQLRQQKSPPLRIWHRGKSLFLSETTPAPAARAGGPPRSKSVDNALAVPWYGRDTATVQPLYSFRWTLASDLVAQEYKPGSRQDPHTLEVILPLQTFLPRSCVTTSSTDNVDLSSPKPGVQLVISRKPWLTRYP